MTLCPMVQFFLVNPVVKHRSCLKSQIGQNLKFETIFQNMPKFGKIGQPDWPTHQSTKYRVKCFPDVRNRNNLY